MKKMNPARVRIVVWCLVAIGAIFGLVGEYAEIRVLAIFGVVVLAGGLVIHLFSIDVPIAEYSLAEAEVIFAPIVENDTTNFPSAGMTGRTAVR